MVSTHSWWLEQAVTEILRHEWAMLQKEERVKHRSGKSIPFKNLLSRDKARLGREAVTDTWQNGDLNPGLPNPNTVTSIPHW